LGRAYRGFHSLVERGCEQGPLASGCKGEMRSTVGIEKLCVSEFDEHSFYWHQRRVFSRGDVGNGLIVLG
jgi:hypothetical protein